MNERVVLVLADPGIRRLLRRCLCARGYTVVDLAGGSELDQVMKRHTVHVVVLDDLAWCSPFRLRWPQVPLLIISPLTEEREKVRALDLGADDYLTQPFDQEEFLARLRAHRRRTRMREEGVFWTASVGSFAQPGWAHDPRCRSSFGLCRAASCALVATGMWLVTCAHASSGQGSLPSDFITAGVGT